MYRCGVKNRIPLVTFCNTEIALHRQSESTSQARTVLLTHVLIYRTVGLAAMPEAPALVMTLGPNLAVNRTPAGGAGCSEHLVGAGYLTR